MKNFNLQDSLEDFFLQQQEMKIPVFKQIKNQKFNSAILDEKLSVLNERWTSAGTLSQLNSMISDCLKCPLGKTRTNFVFGVGNPEAELVLVGEAPGRDEDLQGEPFVGRAGKLLNDALAEVGIKRDEVFICNILKCRPPGNRDPLPEEVAECEPYLYKQLLLLKPKIILALGRIAGNTLLKKQETLTNLRSKNYLYNGIPLFVTYHPAAILRNMNFKNIMMEDFLKVKYFYDTLR